MNYDCVVDGADLGLLIAAWGSDPSSCNFDLNLDGIVEGADLGIVLADWGKTCTLPCPAPELAAMAWEGGDEGDALDPMGQALSAALSSLGFDSVEQFNSWSANATRDSVDAVLSQLAALISK